MKFLVYLLFPILSACGDSIICDYEFPGMCHTEKEWQEISRKNIESLDCLDKPMAICNKKGQGNFEGKCIQAAFKKCKIKPISTMYF